MELFGLPPIMGGGAKILLARWHSDFDCGQETQWWYTIKDTVYDPMTLTSKKRYYINQGRKNFEVRQINPAEHAEAMYEVTVAAFADYPQAYRPTVDKERYIKNCAVLQGLITFGAFYNGEVETDKGRLCGFVHLAKHGILISLVQQKAMPHYEKKNVNFALLDAALTHFNTDLANGCYISNGERNTMHETAYNNFLERYFGFRKAYCKLHLAYPPKIKPLVNLLYHFRHPLKRLNNIGIVHKINAVLQMEEIRRCQ